MSREASGKRGTWSLALALLGAFASEPGWASAIREADVTSYRALLRELEPGDVLRLAPGTYGHGLPVHGLNGAPGKPIVIEGPPGPRRAVLRGAPRREHHQHRRLFLRDDPKPRSRRARDTRRRGAVRERGPIRARHHPREPDHPGPRRGSGHRRDLGSLPGVELDDPGQPYLRRRHGDVSRSVGRLRAVHQGTDRRQRHRGSARIRRADQASGRAPPASGHADAAGHDGAAAERVREASSGERAGGCAPQPAGRPLPAQRPRERRLVRDLRQRLLPESVRGLAAGRRERRGVCEPLRERTRRRDPRPASQRRTASRVHRAKHRPRKGARGARPRIVAGRRLPHRRQRDPGGRTGKRRSGRE